MSKQGTIDYRVRMRSKGLREGRCKCGRVVWIKVSQERGDCGKCSIKDIRKYAGQKIAAAAARRFEESEAVALGRMGPEKIDPLSASRFIDALMR